MALTRAFKETVQARARRDPEFAAGLLSEGVASLLAGDVDTGKSLLRDYINATIGFVALADRIGTSPKGLMRMFGPTGNPQAKKLFAVIARLQKLSGNKLTVTTAA